MCWHGKLTAKGTSLLQLALTVLIITCDARLHMSSALRYLVEVHLALPTAQPEPELQCSAHAQQMDHLVLDVYGPKAWHDRT